MQPYFDMKVKNFHKAVKENQISVAEEALQHVHPIACDDNLDNALILASLHCHYDMLRMLIGKIPEKYRKEYTAIGNQIGVTPIIAACASGSVEILHFLFKFYSHPTLPVTDLGNTCLGIACASGNLGIVQYLVSAGVGLENVPDSICPHPLMLAMINGHEEILLYFYLPSLARSPKLYKFSEEVQREVLQSVSAEATKQIPDVDIDEWCPEFHGLNILALAALLHLRKMFDLLLKLGADLEARVKSGSTVRDVAERFEFDMTSSFYTSSTSSKKSKRRTLFSIIKRK